MKKVNTETLKRLKDDELREISGGKNAIPNKLGQVIQVIADAIGNWFKN